MVLREELTSYGIFTEWLKTRRVSNLLVPHIAGWCPHPQLREQIIFGIRSVVMLDLETALKVMEW